MSHDWLHDWRFTGNLFNLPYKKVDSLNTSQTKHFVTITCVLLSDKRGYKLKIFNDKQQIYMYHWSNVDKTNGMIPQK
jgi:hypothetical protein